VGRDSAVLRESRDSASVFTPAVRDSAFTDPPPSPSETVASVDKVAGCVQV